MPDQVKAAEALEEFMDEVKRHDRNSSELFSDETTATIIQALKALSAAQPQAAIREGVTVNKPANNDGDAIDLTQTLNKLQSAIVSDCLELGHYAAAEFISSSSYAISAVMKSAPQPTPAPDDGQGVE